MRRAYAILLWLYPAEFREMFGAEIVETVELSGRPVMKEVFALLVGAVREHSARRLQPKHYLRSAADFDASLNAKISAREVEGLIESVIGEMQFAIAHHDFPRARICSGQEKRARKRLSELTDSMP